MTIRGTIFENTLLSSRQNETNEVTEVIDRVSLLCEKMSQQVDTVDDYKRATSMLLDKLELNPNLSSNVLHEYRKKNTEISDSIYALKTMIGESGQFAVLLGQQLINTAKNTYNKEQIIRLSDQLLSRIKLTQEEIKRIEEQCQNLTDDLKIFSEKQERDNKLIERHLDEHKIKEESAKTIIKYSGYLAAVLTFFAGVIYFIKDIFQVSLK